MNKKGKTPAIDFQSLFESAPGLYLILIPENFNIVAVSDAYLAATMTTREEILGRGLFDVFPDNPDDKEATGTSNLRASLNTVLQKKSAHTMAVQKYDIRRPDGTFEERFWSPLNKPILNEQKEIVYIIHRVEDVTEFVRSKKEHEKKDKITADLKEQLEKAEIEVFKRAQEIQKMNIGLEELIARRTGELVESEKRFRNTLDKMLEGIQIIGFDWCYIYANDSLVKHGHYTKEELLGYTMMEKYPGIENSEVFKVLKKCMEERVAQHMENEFVYPDGAKSWFELSIQPVPEGIFVLSIDISERKKAEEEVRQLNENLEKKVAERTEQLINVNKELESFSYSVSHDLRAPLRAINGYANMIVEDYNKVLDEEGKRLLEVVQYNAKKMSTLIDDLLAFSRLGKKEIEKTTIDMEELVDATLSELSKTAERFAEIKKGKLTSVKADYSLMNQVFLNLISNGIKYSSKKEKPVVEINSSVKDNEVIYSVSDNGVGFDMKYSHKLFGVFQRLHSGEEFEGTGVGLAIVQRIINKHGGKVWADAQLGKGATFYFSLPAA
jgi:PAS domain S-box-containing protein